MKICVLGAGGVGSALADNLAHHGHDAYFGVRDPGRVTTSRQRAVPLVGAAADADIVIIAVPMPAAPGALAAASPAPECVVVDSTNPTRFAVPPGYTSGARWISEQRPGTRLVKAFNIVGAESMRNPRFGDQSVLLPVASDDVDARLTVVDLGREMGFDAVDAGRLDAAALLEHAAAYWVHLALNAGIGRDFAIGALRRPR